nr:sce7726 family protein [uncultured Butyrivibrio sp.]
MLRDMDIRDGLCDYLETEYGKIRFFEELTMGKSRADIVMVTEQGLYGIEIKSDADTYERLSRQVRDYDRFFDFNYVVVGSSHAGHIKEHVPDHWGIITVEDVGGNLDCYEMRSPKRSPKVKLTNQMGLLWKRELAILQEQNGLYKYSDKSKMYRKKYLMESVDKELLRKQMLEVFFERDYSIFED